MTLGVAAPGPPGPVARLPGGVRLGFRSAESCATLGHAHPRLAALELRPRAPWAGLVGGVPGGHLNRRLLPLGLDVRLGKGRAAGWMVSSLEEGTRALGCSAPPVGWCPARGAKVNVLNGRQTRFPALPEGPPEGRPLKGTLVGGEGGGD